MDKTQSVWRRNSSVFATLHQREILISPKMGSLLHHRSDQEVCCNHDGELTSDVRGLLLRRQITIYRLLVICGKKKIDLQDAVSLFFLLWALRKVSFYNSFYAQAYVSFAMSGMAIFLSSISPYNECAIHQS